MKKFVKMNNNTNFLSLGNVFDCIKSIACNKENAMQSELFCTLFQVDSINSTTVNNYCVGARAISVEYKKIIIELKNKISIDENIYLKPMLSLINILDDYVYKYDENIKTLVNQNSNLEKLCQKLIIIAKVDEHIENNFIEQCECLLEKKDLYNLFIKLFIYSVLENIQPLYKQSINIKINKDELDDYLKVKLYEGYSYTNSLIELAKKNNIYACADLGSMEFYGQISGVIDYEKSYEYYLKAANKNHPKACFMIANLILTKKVDKDFDTLWAYLKKAIDLGSTSALNTMGLCYKFGINKDKKIDLEKAKYYFELASNDGYVYAYNNLGLLCENEKDALTYFKISADLGESWALNKVGLYYLKNNDYKTAFVYFNKSIEAPLKERNKWGYYNLAKNYYDKGCIKENKKLYDKYMNIFLTYK